MITKYKYVVYSINNNIRKELVRIEATSEAEAKEIAENNGIKIDGIKYEIENIF